MKRIVICLDGTWNNASREVEKDDKLVYRPTNVLKVARAVCTQDMHGVAQISYYDAGVGAMNRAPDIRTKVLKKADNLLGGGWGAGFDTNIEEAYTFLANNFEAGDEVFIFGFSRGAAQARSLCRLIQWMGGFPPKIDAYYVPMFFEKYLEQRGEGTAETIVNELNKSREERHDSHRVSITPARVKFLGVWDTVLALGWRIRAREASTGHALAFHTSKEPPTIVDVIRHAIAIDEQRHDFQAEVWDPADNLEQRWFPGVHANVGGGMNDDSLANSALHWICRAAAQCNLAMNDDFLSFFRQNPVGMMGKKPGSYKFIDGLLCPIRGFHGVRDIPTQHTTLDDSVFLRLHKFPDDYKPPNLMKYLEAVDNYDQQLPPKLLKELGR